MAGPVLQHCQHGRGPTAGAFALLLQAKLLNHPQEAETARPLQPSPGPGERAPMQGRRARAEVGGGDIVSPLSPRQATAKAKTRYKFKARSRAQPNCF